MSSAASVGARPLGLSKDTDGRGANYQFGGRSQRRSVLLAFSFLMPVSDSAEAEIYPDLETLRLSADRRERPPHTDNRRPALGLRPGSRQNTAGPPGARVRNSGSRPRPVRSP